MKNKLLLLVAFSITATTGITQNSRGVVPSQGPPPAPIFSYDLQGKPLAAKTTVEDVEGYPYLLEDWTWGAVKFRNRQLVKDVKLKFDIYTNKLFFYRDNTEYEFVTPVEEFLLGYIYNTDSLYKVFRNGYPAVDKSNEETFYEVLADGKVQLLNCSSKDVLEYKSYNQPVRRKFMKTEQLYAFLPANKLVKIKKDKADIIKAMPEYAAAIEKIITGKKLKLKKTEDVTELFTALNKL